jgi:hypothetical protein
MLDRQAPELIIRNAELNGSNMECPNRYKCLTSSGRYPFRKCINGQRVKFTYFQHGGKALKVRGRINGTAGDFLILYNVRIQGKVLQQDKFLNQRYTTLHGGVTWFKEYTFKLKHCRFIEKPILCGAKNQKINGSKEVEGKHLAGNPLTMTI